MKKNLIFLSLLVLSLLMVACGETKKAEMPKKDRNMFGLGLPRGLTKSTEGLADGYVMFSVTNSGSTYLINRKGEVVKEWKSTYGGYATSAYLGEDGSLMQNAADPDFPVFAGGGEAGRLQKISWDNKILWDFEFANEQHHIHHDFVVMPNGNILAIAWEAKSVEEVLAAGRKPEMTPKAGLWPDKIIEIAPEGKYGGKIVWEWHIWDHLVQDFDAKKANYGKPAEHPELLDINAGEPLPPAITQDSLDKLKIQGRAWRNQTLENFGSDVYHFNAIKYNAKLDQIAISSPHLHEIFIIDHSTTTKETTGHTGGKMGKGGDFLYRWGNAHNYQRADSTAQQLFGQHDIRWIEEGKPGAGNLTVFNNAPPKKFDQNKQGSDSLNYSAVYELTPPVDEKGNYILEKDKAFGPAKPTWTYTAPDKLSFYSSFISGAHRMKNGNTFINEGAKGRFFEVTPDGKIVWEYLNPYRGEIRKLNGDPIPAVPLVYIQFRSTFIPADHPALKGKKLQSLNPQPKPFVLPPMPPKK